MRYYLIKLSPPSGIQAQPIKWTSHPNGLMQPPDPNALNVEFDLFETLGYVSAGDSTLSIQGVPLSLLMQGTYFGIGNNHSPGWNIEIHIGMGKGLPLANPKQAGMVIKGMVKYSWANWEGTEMDLDFVVYGGGSSNPAKAAPIVHNQPPSTPLHQAIKNALQVAYPGMPLTINVSENLIWNYPLVGYYPNLDSYARAMKDLTQGFGGNSNYSGFDIGFSRGGVTIFDGSTPPQPVKLDYTDFVGQPTWISPGGAHSGPGLQAKLVARADLQMGGIVNFPPGMVAAPGMSQMTAQGYPYGNKLTFSGNFLITGLRHMGNFRMRDGAQWVTIINCVGIGGQ